MIYTPAHVAWFVDPINCASGCAANDAIIIHAAIRAEHRGDAFYHQSEVDQIKLDLTADADERDQDRVHEIGEWESGCAALERDLAVSNSFGNWPWIRT